MIKGDPNPFMNESIEKWKKKESLNINRRHKDQWMVATKKQKIESLIHSVWGKLLMKLKNNWYESKSIDSPLCLHSFDDKIYSIFFSFISISPLQLNKIHSIFVDSPIGMGLMPIHDS